MWGDMLSRLHFRYTMIPKDETLQETAEDESHDEASPSIINIWGRRDR